MIRVLIVDDSALIRRLISAALVEATDLVIVGKAKDGLEAVEMVEELNPDVVTLDIEMPNLDGLGALEVIRQRHPRLPVIMFSTLTERGAAATLEALSRGASDYVTKPSNTGSVAEGIASVRDQLVPRIRALVGMRALNPDGPRDKALRPRASVETLNPVRRPTDAPPEILVIGCSTGGPDALARLFAELPAELRLPILVVQHMPPVFTAMLAQRLDKISRLTVREAVQGEAIEPGTALIAPGDFHMEIARSGQSTSVVLHQGPQENFCRPAVDVLFRSAATIHGGAVVASVLTGMGQDGLEGARSLAELSAQIVVQDEESSVVWGMPGAIAMAGLATSIEPLGALAPALTRACGLANSRS